MLHSRPLAAALALLGACTSPAPDDAADHPAGGEATASPPRALAAPTLRFRPCGGGFECGTLEVPIDHAAPAAGSLALAVKRLPARGAREGALLVNFGGPGGSAVGALTSFVAQSTAPWLEHFDVVAFDPRGVGESTPLDCHSGLRRLTSIDPAPDSEAEWRAIDEAAAAFAAECAEKHAALLPHLGTEDVARDMDRVRAALGDETIRFLGFSYGTTIGAWYAELFPERVRAMVLDGAVDLRKSGLELTRVRAASFERAFAGYLAHCEASGCAWTRGEPPARAFAALRAGIERAPLPARAADRPAQAGELMLAVIFALYGGEASFPDLSRALDAAAHGDGSLIVAFADAYLQRRPDGSYPNLFELTYAVNCLDFPAPDRATVRAAAASFAAEAPTFGLTALSGVEICTHWPVRAATPPVPRGEGAPPIVVIGTLGDPVTPYAWAEGLADTLASGRLVTFEGDGHTAYGRGGACITRLVDRYLTTAEPPAAGTRCGR